jgi:hypothetical protein
LTVEEFRKVKRGSLVLLVLLMVVLPFALVGDTAGQAADPPCIDRYVLNQPSGSPVYTDLKYIPRGFVDGLDTLDPTWTSETVGDSASYDTWDVLTTTGLNYGSNRTAQSADWVEIELAQQCTVGVIARNGGTQPTCLASGWSSGSTVTVGGVNYTVKTQVLGPGSFDLCGVRQGLGSGGNLNTPLLIFGEADGSAPDGTLTNSNATCDAGLYSATEWHRQIDPATWCYERHHHGVDPENCHPDWNRVFGEPATALGMTEPEGGFKVGVFDNPVDDDWKICYILHQGTAGSGRICEPFHSLALALVYNPTNTIYADTYQMVDFGPMVENDTQADVVHDDCPDQADDGFARAGSNALRQMPDDEGNGGYEPWRPWFQAWTVPGVGTVTVIEGNLVVNPTLPMTGCDDPADCDLIQLYGQDGARAFFQGSDLSFSPESGTPTGYFCITQVIDDDPTVPMTTTTSVLNNPNLPCAAGKVKQFIHASLIGQDIEADANRAFEGVDGGWGLPMVATTGTDEGHTAAREGSIRNQVGTLDVN